MGMNSQKAIDKAINLMNEEGKELTVDFLMNSLAIEHSTQVSVPAQFQFFHELCCIQP